VPVITTLNKKVPPELERIIAKSLARDATTRYQTARDLGIDLSKFMFKFGVAVSTFEIARLVQGAMKERQRARPQQASIIDKLIEEALLEFTSLTEDGKGSGAGPAAPVSLDGGGGARPQAGEPGYVNVGNWLDEISSPNVGAGRHDPMRNSLPPGIHEGNLAALEDDEPLAPAVQQATARPPTPVPSQRTPPASVPQPAPPSARPFVPPAPLSARGEPKKGKGALVGILLALVLVVGGGVAALWFTNVIH